MLILDASLSALKLSLRFYPEDDTWPWVFLTTAPEHTKSTEPLSSAALKPVADKA